MRSRVVFFVATGRSCRTGWLGADCSGSPSSSTEKGEARLPACLRGDRRGAGAKVGTRSVIGAAFACLGDCGGVSSAARGPAVWVGVLLLGSVGESSMTIGGAITATRGVFLTDRASASDFADRERTCAGPGAPNAARDESSSVRSITILGFIEPSTLALRRLSSPCSIRYAFLREVLPFRMILRSAPIDPKSASIRGMTV